MALDSLPCNQKKKKKEQKNKKPYCFNKLDKKTLLF